MPKIAIGPLVLSATLSSAFIIVTMGTQYYGMDPFNKEIGLGDTGYGRFLSWLAAISGGYVMVFSRSAKLYNEINSALEEITIKARTEGNTLTCGFKMAKVLLAMLNPQKKRPLHPITWMVWTVAAAAGFLRSVTQGYTSTQTLLHACYVYNQQVVDIVSIPVCASNAFAFHNFTVNRSAENIDYLIKDLPAGYGKQKVLAIGLGTPSAIATFGYNYWQIKNGYTAAPGFKKLSEVARIGLSIPTAGVSVGIGGISKGIQFFKTTIKNKQQPELKDEKKDSSSEKLPAFDSKVKEPVTSFSSALIPSSAPSDAVGINILPNDTKSAGGYLVPINGLPSVNSGRYSNKVISHIFFGFLYVLFFLIISAKGLGKFMVEQAGWGEVGAEIFGWIFGLATAVMEGPFTVGYMIEEAIEEQRKTKNTQNSQLFMLKNDKTPPKNRDSLKQSLLDNQGMVNHG